MSIAELTPVRPRTYSPSDLLTLPDGESYELVDGQLLEKPMGAEADGVAAELTALVRNLVRLQRLGWVFGSSTGYSCFPDDPDKIRRPDASFVRRGRFPRDKVPRGFVKVPPDLAIEVVSPHDRYEEVDAKVREFLTAGVPLVWVVNPQSRTVHVFRRDGSTLLLTAEQVLEGEDVLPGFQCPVGELFANALD